ncbi:MAG: hypothetical protein ABFD79_17535 [Phycisphaerales bacterium]
MAITKNQISKIKYQNCGICQRQELFLFPFIFVLLILSMPFLSGCQEKQKTEKQAKAQLTSQNEVKETKQTTSTAKLSAEVNQLKKQVESLMGLNKEARTEALSTLSAVQITERSGLYENEQTKKKDKLVVYLRPIDDIGDVVKAAGTVEIELWNLNAKPENAMVAQWKVSPEELKKKWTSSLLSNHYKLEFDTGSILTGQEKELTLKVQFTDYLTGKVFKSQLVINK